MRLEEPIRVDQVVFAVPQQRIVEIDWQKQRLMVPFVDVAVAEELQPRLVPRR